jgi:hypothetical protein
MVSWLVDRNFASPKSTTFGNSPVSPRTRKMVSGFNGRRGLILSDSSLGSCLARNLSLKLCAIFDISETDL